jgi:uncharacterized protein YndB with AHSA1/START domain
MSDTEFRELTVRRHIKAPPESVFRLWTEADLIKKWWGHSGVTCPTVDVDLSVGGNYRIANLFPNGATVWIHGEFEVIDPPNRLSYTWGLGLETVPKERVTVTFLPVNGGTDVAVHHENVPGATERDSHEHGWIGCLERLAVLAGAIGAGETDALGSSGAKST